MVKVTKRSDVALIVFRWFSSNIVIALGDRKYYNLAILEEWDWEHGFRLDALLTIND